jgi:hypothetical protein
MLEPLTVRQLDPRSFDEWNMMQNVVKRAAPPTVEVTPVLLGNIRKALLAGEMSGWMFTADSPLGIVLTMIREDRLLGKREMIIYAAAKLRDLTPEDWRRCFAKMRLHSLKEGCTHMSFYTVVPHVIDMAKCMGWNAETRYVSIPLGGKKDA